MGDIDKFVGKVDEFAADLISQFTEALNGKKSSDYKREAIKFITGQPCWIESKATEVKENRSVHTAHEMEVSEVVVVPVYSGEFIPTENFVLNEDKDATVRIKHINENFTNWFLSGLGKGESSTEKHNLICYKLLKTFHYHHLVEHFGGRKKVETSLFDLFTFIKSRNDRGRCDYINVFHIPDYTDTLRAVSVYWDVGWVIEAKPLVEFNGWFGGGATRLFLNASRYPL